MIAVINFGGQTCHLIARRVREIGVYSEILSCDISAEEIEKLNPDGIILSGGPSSVYEKNAPSIDSRILELGIPVLGICYGLQLIAKMCNGEVAAGNHKEFGKTTLRVVKTGRLLKGFSDREQVWMSHGDIVMKLPEDFELLGTTDSCRYVAIQNVSRKIYGIQFHAEVSHTIKGGLLMRNFVIGICNAKRDWHIAGILNSIIKDINREVSNDSVIMAVSGGVDSTVAATLLHRAIGNRLYCVFVDHGLIRNGEADEVKGFFKNELRYHNFYFVDASKIFLQKLKGIVEPEEKRRIIGHTFIKIFEDKVAELGKAYKNIKFLGQGTIYPDRIESAHESKNTSKIKSHHNLTLPKKMKLRVIEPLREFYKDEVRILGREIGIPNKLLERHPFTGPALAIRILGEVTKERLRILRDADFIFIEELRKANYYDKVWQAFAALLPVKSVGVMGDARTYEYIISLRAVTSMDAMTADWARLPYGLLERISNRIINEVKGVNRIVYDISQKPPATIEYE